MAFEPKPHQEFDEAAWKGEALIDAAEYQPVLVHTKLAIKIPLAVKTLLGTDIKGLGFSVALSEIRGRRMVSGELWRGVRGTGGILLQADDLGEHDEQRSSAAPT